MSSRKSPRNTFADPTVPELPQARAELIPGEPLPLPPGVQAGRETLLGRGLWIGLVGVALLLAFLLFGESGAHAGGSAPATATKAHGDGFFPGTADLSAALAEARKQGRKGVAVLYEMNGCGECAKLRATTLQDAGLRQDFRRSFVAVSLMADEPGALTNFEGQATTLSGFARDERVFALPALVFYDLDGLPVARQTGSALSIAGWRQLTRYVAEAGYEEAPFPVWQAAHGKGG